MKTVAISSLVLIAQVSANAAVLVDWDFSGIPAEPVGSENTPPPHPLLLSTNANAAAGLSSSDLDHVGLTYSTAVAPGGVGTSVAGELNIKNFDRGGDGINDHYIFFTLAADAGNTLNIDTLSINLWRNGGGAPNGIAFDVSVDSGPFELYDAVQTQGTGAGVPVLREFNESITGAASVEIRFTPRNAGQGSTGNFHISGLTVEGSVIPEPSGALLSLVGTGLLALRRRRQ